MDYSLILKAEGLVPDITSGNEEYEVPKSAEGRRLFLKAYEALCKEHGYQLFGFYDGNPSVHDPLMIVECPSDCDIVILSVPCFINGEEQGWN